MRTVCLPVYACVAWVCAVLNENRSPFVEIACLSRVLRHC